MSVRSAWNSREHTKVSVPNPISDLLLHRAIDIYETVDLRYVELLFFLYDILRQI
jgi:hypothetical protein